MRRPRPWRATAQGRRIAIVRGDALHTGLAPGWADVVVYRLVLHHVVDTAGAVRDAARIVAPGGCILIEDGARLSDFEFTAMNAQLAQAGSPLEPLPGIDPLALAGLLRKAGVAVEPVHWRGTMTFATPPFTVRDYTAPRSLIVGRRPPPQPTGEADS